MPDSFLTQVLLAEQDNVRKVLFETSLAEDSDESGRLRLTEALGALAQDPLFKKILDETQAHVDEAFTATGKKKRGASSPFTAMIERINEMRRERDELDSRVRETASAEERIRGLNLEHDRLGRDLDDARALLAQAEAQHATRLRRDDVLAQLQTHRAAVLAVDEARRQIEAAQLELERQTAAAARTDAALAELVRDLARDEAARDETRARHDALAHDEGPAQRAMAELEERQRANGEDLFEAKRTLERATADLRLAREVADAIATATISASREDANTAGANAVVAAAAGESARVEQALKAAEARLRDATSGDRVQALALRRTELENLQLTRIGQRTVSEHGLRQAEAVGQAVATAVAAEASTQAALTQVARALGAVTEADTTLARLDAEREHDRQMEWIGQLQHARAAMAAAQVAGAEAESLRAQAAQLRIEEAALRAKIPREVPAAEAIAALRSLREQVRLAEARLGGGVSVTVRPKRPVVMRATRDGAVDPPLTSVEASTFTANRVIALDLDGLVEIEVTAGEATARRDAAEIRARWEREGTPVLRLLAVESVEQLEGLRNDADAALRAADDRNREAEHADARATQHTASADTTAYAVRLAELERNRGVADRAELAAALGALGAGWQNTLLSRTSDFEARRQQCASQVEGARRDLMRQEAQLEAAALAAASSRAEATRQHAALQRDWTEVAARYRAEVTTAERELAEISQQLGELDGSATGEEAAASAVVATAEAAALAARRYLEHAQASAQRARDAAVEAATKLTSARNRAREIDTHGAWATSSASAELPLTRWQEALDRATEARDAQEAVRMGLVATLAKLVEERHAARTTSRLALDAAEGRFRATRTRHDEAQEGARTLARQKGEVKAQVAELRIQVAGANLDAARAAIAALEQELATLGDPIGAASARDLASCRTTVAGLIAQARETEEDLARARGALEQVGGAIVRERHRELVQALDAALALERETERSFEGWMLLRETLRECESTEGAHIGRALAEPVSARFRQLTGGRYGTLELGAHLESAGLQIAGDRRDIHSLSAGTQDQLATLLRLCIAEQLKSTIVLDDHLSQSDPRRVAWFNEILRTTALNSQIVLITCRPGEVLASAEFPAAGEAALTGPGGLVRAIDLTAVIRRFGPAVTEAG